MGEQLSVSLSYAPGDRQIAHDIAAELSRRDVRVWVDEGELRAEDSLVARISAAREEALFAVVLVSPESVPLPWCQRELPAAIAGRLAREGVKLLPLRIGDVALPGPLDTIAYLDADPARPADVADRLISDAARHHQDMARARQRGAGDAPLLVLKHETAYGSDSIAWQPGGDLIAVGNGDRSVNVVAADGSTGIHLPGWDYLEPPGPPTLTDPAGSIVRWSADGTALLQVPYREEGRGTVWRLTDGRLTAGGAAPGRLPLGDGGRLPGVLAAGWLGPDPCVLTGATVLNCRTGETVPLHGAGAGGRTAAAEFSPDMRHVAVSFTGPGAIAVFAVAGGGQVWAPQGGYRRAPFSFSWSPDGRHLTADTEESTELWRLGDPAPAASFPAEWRGGARAGHWPVSRWSRSGLMLAVGGRIMRYSLSESGELGPAPSPSGQWPTVMDIGPPACVIDWSSDTRFVSVPMTATTEIEIWDAGAGLRR